MEPKGKNEIKVSSNHFVEEKKGSIKEHYRIGSCLGQGAYGEVRKCQHKASGSMRAIKIIKKAMLDPAEREKLINEVTVLKELDHPNILKLYEFFQDSKYFYLVTELCTGGELFDKITEEQFLGEKDAAHIMNQVISAINYCHSQNVVHRDLKPENLLLDAPTPHPKIKIIDFGTSQIFDPTKKMDQKYGTPYYIAPEVLKKNYNEKCDLWSCGVILYILLCGYPPFNGPNDKAIIEAVIRGKFTLDEPEWDSVSPEAKDLVRKLLTYDLNKRISASDALQHPWFKKMLVIEKMDSALANKALSNLRGFRAEEKLKQAALTFIVSQLVNKEEMDQMEKAFKALDKNKDGKLSKEEILEGYQEYFGKPIDEDEVNNMMKMVDTDGSGTIDYSEFVMAAMNQSQLLTQEKLEAAFKMFDKDGSGTISIDEIKETLGKGAGIPESAYREVLKEVDENGDGEISFEEFTKMMKKLTVVSTK